MVTGKRGIRVRKPQPPQKTIATKSVTRGGPCSNSSKSGLNSCISLLGTASSFTAKKSAGLAVKACQQNGRESMHTLISEPSA